MNIRKFTLRASRLSDLVELGSLSPASAYFPAGQRPRASLKVLVAGA